MLEAALLVGAQCKFWVPSHGTFKEKHSGVCQENMAHSFEPSGLDVRVHSGQEKGMYGGGETYFHIK